MSTGKILTNEQAKAVADAMAYLNNFNGRLHVRIPHSNEPGVWAHVKELQSGEIQCWVGDVTGMYLRRGSEEYAAQHAFLAAYGVSHGRASVPNEGAL